MTMALTLAGAFPSEEALRRMILARKVCFDHDPFYVRNAAGDMVQIGFQLNLYAAFNDPRHLPHSDDQEQREILRDLHGICRVFFQSLDVLKPCEYPDPPADRIVYSPERNYRADVCVQIPVFDRSHFGWPADRRVSDILDTVECLLKSLGARWKRWDEEATPAQPSPETCEAKARQAADLSDEGAA
ncbi:hypothetical protein DNFV4_04356 [Nitrospira tepida]|uniref:Uncharacterized protein n=1 Tax=Nitrospira tepida TaxID=2973512 RepID=A0AA86N3A9_9BACT|nr:hypothetical protein [Nitrospira tepida]CAI4033914.1 hypothetical protein DNFV4_04356 [Nitrospira tepida]